MKSLLRRGVRNGATAQDHLPVPAQVRIRASHALYHAIPFVVLVFYGLVGLQLSPVLAASTPVSMVSTAGSLRTL
jgi:hypothetical protein